MHNPTPISTLLLLATALQVQSRQISFPPVFEYQNPLLQDDTQIDPFYSQSFRGLTTFANLPFVQGCISNNTEVPSYDIAIIGAPFDTVSNPGTNEA